MTIFLFHPYIYKSVQNEKKYSISSVNKITYKITYKITQNVILPFLHLRVFISFFFVSVETKNPLMMPDSSF